MFWLIALFLVVLPTSWQGILISPGDAQLLVSPLVILSKSSMIAARPRSLGEASSVTEAVSFSPYAQSRFPWPCIFMYIHVYAVVYSICRSYTCNLYYAVRPPDTYETCPEYIKGEKFTENRGKPRHKLVAGD